MPAHDGTKENFFHWCNINASLLNFLTRGSLRAIVLPSTHIYIYIYKRKRPTDVPIRRYIDAADSSNSSNDAKTVRHGTQVRSKICPFLSPITRASLCVHTKAAATAHRQPHNEMGLYLTRVRDC